MGRFSLLLLVILLPVAGCSSNTVVKNWAKDHGGTVCDHRSDRASALAAAIARNRPDVRMEVAVLNRDDLSAFSWPGGQIYLSRGLVDALDDAALSAAIAHEIAHILKHHEAGMVSALRNGEASFEQEARADRVGVELLASCGLPPGSMARMLSEVLRRDGLPKTVQQDLRRRIELLRP